MRSIKYQPILIAVPAANAVVNINASADKLYDKITGIALEFPYELNLFGSQIQLSIAGEELFPENYEAKRITSSQDVSPNDRFYQGTRENPLEDEAKGSLVAGKFIDGGQSPAYPYVAILTLRLENNKQ